MRGFSGGKAFLASAVFLMFVVAITAYGAAALAQTKKSKMVADEFFVTSSNLTTFGVNYHLRGVEYNNAVEMMKSAGKIYEQELAQITPAFSQTGGKLRIALSSHERNNPIISMFRNWDPDPKVNDAIIANVLEYGKLFDKTFIEALKKSGLFRSIVVEQDETDPPDPNGADYVASRIGTHWMIAHGDGPRGFIRFKSDTGFSGMVKTLPDALQQAQKLAKKNPFAILTKSVNTKIVYIFNGMEFDSAEKTLEAAKAEWSERMTSVERVDAPAGGVARIVLSTYKKNYEAWKKQRTDDYVNRDTVPMLRVAFNKTMANAHVEAIKTSGVFDEVVVEKSDEQPSSMEGYDYLLWQSADDPHVWFFRTHGMDEAKRLSGYPSESLMKWANYIATYANSSQNKTGKKLNAFLWPSPPPESPGA